MSRKLNWEKTRTEVQIAKYNREEYLVNEAKQDYYRLLEKNLWPVKGKHKGKPIISLDTSYLLWISKKFSGEVQTIARNELRKRQLANNENTKQAREKIKALRQNK